MKIAKIITGISLLFTPFISAQTCPNGTTSKWLEGSNVKTKLNNVGAVMASLSYGEHFNPKNSTLTTYPEMYFMLAGKKGNELAMSGSLNTYATVFLPGAHGSTLSCTDRDKMYKVNREDIKKYQERGILSDDLRDWPYQLGAPVLDGDGNPNNYDLSKGDRPLFPLENPQTGEKGAYEMIWWVLHDGKPLALQIPRMSQVEMEVQITAFTLHEAHFAETNFFKLKIIYKGETPLTDAYFGFGHSQLPIGYANPMVASDSTLKFGYNWAKPLISEEGGYGNRAPAIGTYLIQNKAENSNTSLQTTSFVELQKNDTPFSVYRVATIDFYNYLQGKGVDGLLRNSGLLSTGITNPHRTKWHYWGNVTANGTFWSENCHNQSACNLANLNGLRWDISSSGPFNMQKGEVREILLANLFARGNDAFDSVDLLKKQVQRLQQGFATPAAKPDAPTLSVILKNGEEMLSWTNAATSNNHQNSFRSPARFILPSENPDSYSLEGYVLRRYENPADKTGKIIQVFDKVNDVTSIYVPDLYSFGTVNAVHGPNLGLANEWSLKDLAPFETAWFSVQPYAYHPTATPQLIWGAESAKKEVFKGAAQVSNRIDLADVMPNPYRGASIYELGGNDEVRFINLPAKCTLRIFSTNGTLVKIIEKDDNNGVIAWNLKNDEGTKIASGMYLVHIDAGALGEKILKLGIVKKKD